MSIRPCKTIRSAGARKSGVLMMILTELEIYVIVSSVVMLRLFWQVWEYISPREGKRKRKRKRVE